MDNIPGLTTHSKLERQERLTTPTPTPTPHSSNSNITTEEQPAITNTPTGDIPPPHFMNSINELRSYSTALSAFLSRYDELHKHLNFIKSSIDSKLPNHLVDATNPNRSALTRALETSLPEAVVSEQSPKGSASDCERSHAIARTPESTFFSHNSEEIDTSKMPEVVDVSKNHEEIDVSIEFDTSKKPDEIDTLMKPEETAPETSCDETASTVPEAFVSEQNPNGIATDCDQSHETVRTPKSPNGIYTDCEQSRQTVRRPEILEEIDASKKLEVIETSKTPRQTDILLKPEEIDLLKKSEETVPASSSDQTIASVQEAIVSEQNRNRIATDCEQSHETVRTPKNPNGSTTDCEQSHETVRTLEILEVIDISKKPEVIDISKKPKQTDILNKPEEIDLFKKPEEIVVLKKPEETDILKKPEQTDICKNPEEIAILKKPEQIDTSMNPEEIGTSKKHEEAGIWKKGKEINVLRKHEEIETSKKSIVSVLEFLCESMRSKKMKWHVGNHLSEMNQLHKEIAKALKLAKSPARLVLESIGRFFVQGSRTFCKGSHQIKQNVGRLASVLILECFVMISSDGIEIAKRDQEHAAEAAVDWRKRMIREGGLRHTEEVDARGLLLLISGFGIQDHVFKIQDILDLIRASNVKGISTALRRSVFLVPKIPEVIDLMVKSNLEIEAADIAYTFGLEDKCHPRNILVTYLHKKIRDIQYASSFQMLEAVKQHLFDLNSVKQCLQSHNIDSSMLLPDVKIDEKIQNLEKEINEWKLIQKRKSLENPIHHESKRACFSHENMTRQHKPVDHYGMNPYNRSARPSTSYFDHDRNRCNSYSPSSVYNEPAPATHEYIPGSYDQMVHQANVQPYDWHEPHGQHYSRHGQTYDPQPHVRPWGWDPPASGGFRGRRSPSSDLYHFVDKVEEEARDFHASGSNGA